MIMLTRQSLALDSELSCGIRKGYLIFIMSLLIVGSCSRVTANIVLALAKNNLYRSITIADLLPLYDHHHRYYKLRRQLSDQKSTIPVTLEKLINI